MTDQYDATPLRWWCHLVWILLGLRTWVIATLIRRWLSKIGVKNRAEKSRAAAGVDYKVLTALVFQDWR